MPMGLKVLLSLVALSIGKTVISRKKITAVIIKAITAGRMPHSASLTRRDWLNFSSERATK